jgi:hypothetical protein
MANAIIYHVNFMREMRQHEPALNVSHPNREPISPCLT